MLLFFQLGDLFLQFTMNELSDCLSMFCACLFPFGFEDRVRDLVVLVLGNRHSFYFGSSCT